MPALVYARPKLSKRELAARVASRLGMLRAVRRTRAGRGLLVLAYHRIGDPRSCPVDSCVYSATADRLRERFKSNAYLDKERFVHAVEETLGTTAAGGVGELFASWDELQEMRDGGMDLASHTHTHRIPGHLPFEEQREELARSREVLRE